MLTSPWWRPGCFLLKPKPFSSVWSHFEFVAIGAEFPETMRPFTGLTRDWVLRGSTAGSPELAGPLRPRAKGKYNFSGQQVTVEDSPLRCFSLLMFVCLTEFASDQDVEETLSWLFSPFLPPSLPPSSDSSTKLFTSKESYLVGQRQTPELQATVSLLLLVKLTYLKTKSLLWGHFAIFLPCCTNADVLCPTVTQKTFEL